MKTLERDTFANEDIKVKDDIKEGKHDAHAALRYAHQRIMNWMPLNQIIPEPEEVNETVGY
jgi:SLT domain-containing protein